jgi:protein-S-isoprenylcysteine O-methyltransferase Ste14
VKGPLTSDIAPALRAWPQILVGGAIVLGFAVDLILGLDRPHALFTLVGGPLIVAAVLTNIWCARLLKEHDTPIQANRPARALVTDGPYFYTRNPIYASYVALVLGLGLVLGSWTLTLLAPFVAVALHYISVLPEERHLQQKFGEKYAQYTSETPRWLFR